MPRTAARKKTARPKERVRRTLMFKFRVTAEEQRTIRDRARGYPNPAEFARRSLLAGWAVPVARLGRITTAFEPIQEVIDRARERGLEAEAEQAAAALREILAAVTER